MGGIIVLYVTERQGGRGSALCTKLHGKKGSRKVAAMEIPTSWMLEERESSRQLGQKSLLVTSPHGKAGRSRYCFGQGMVTPTLIREAFSPHQPWAVYSARTDPEPHKGAQVFLVR